MVSSERLAGRLGRLAPKLSTHSRRASQRRANFRLCLQLHTACTNLTVLQLQAVAAIDRFLRRIISTLMEQTSNLIR